MNIPKNLWLLLSFFVIKITEQDLPKLLSISFNIEKDIQRKDSNLILPLNFKK